MAMPAYNPLGAFLVGVAERDRQQDIIRRLGLSPRQHELNRYWSYYSATQHDHKSVSWDGRKALTSIERQTIERSTVLPPGFVDPGGMFDEIPLSMRQPTAPYHLCRSVVNRFTGLLFASKTHPSVRVAGNPTLQSWIESLIKASRLWIRFALARTFGGGQGSVAVSFRFVRGRPRIDVHDPRWCIPSFIDQSTGELAALEIRYMYPVEQRNRDGEIEQVMYWYRRVIDCERDVIYKPAPVGEGAEPAWVAQSEVVHGFGECPAVWIRNTQTDDVDGEPDCFGIFEAQDAIDRLISQADQGAVENADPTLEIDSDEYRLAEIRKGSRNALKLEKGGSARYIEMSGTGVEIALKVADVHRRNALEVAQCVLDFEHDGAQMTATEVERRLSPMHERGDLLREQYGEHGVKPLVAKMVRAVIAMRRAAAAPVPGDPSVQYDPATGLRQVPVVVLDCETPRDLVQFTDDALDLVWPPWVQKGAQDAQAAAGAVAAARAARALDQESAVAYVAPYFGVDDSAAALDRLSSETDAADAALTDGFLNYTQSTASHPPASQPPASKPSITPESEPVAESGQLQKPADQALNGAQISSMIEVIKSVTMGEVSRESASAILQLAFLVDPSEAERLLGPKEFQPQIAPEPGTRSP